MAIIESIVTKSISLFGNHFLCLTTSTLIQSLLELRLEKEASPSRLSKPFYWLKGFLYVYWFAELVRVYYYGLLLESDTSLLDHLPVDTFNGAFFLRLKFTNRHTVPVIVLGGLFVIFIDYHFCFAVDSASLTLFQEVSFENRRNFWTLNKHLREPKWTLRRPLSSLSEYWQAMVSLWKGSDKQLTFARTHLTTLPNLSTKLRSRMVVVFTLLDSVSILANLWTASCLILLLIFHLIIVVDHVGWLSFTLAIADALFFGYFVWSAIRFGIVSSLTGGTLSFVICSHLRELNSSLGLAITQQTMLASIGNHCSGALQRQLAFFRLEHHYLLRLSQHVNVHLVSRLLLALFLTNSLYNIVTLNVLLRANVDLGEQVFLVLMIVVEGLLPLVECSIFAAWSSAFYTCDRLLFRAQACLVRSGNALTYPKILLAKLQLLPFYEFICTENKFRFTVGQVGNISKRALFEFFFTYTSIFMYVSKLMTRLHAYQKEAQLL